MLSLSVYEKLFFAFCSKFQEYYPVNSPSLDPDAFGHFCPKKPLDLGTKPTKINSAPMTSFKILTFIFGSLLTFAQ